MATAPRFWRENPSRYNLVGIKCNNCGRQYFPPRAICPVCHRKSVGKLETTKLRGTGKIFSLSEVHEGLEEMSLNKPYVMAIVELDEGPKVTAQIIDCEPGELEIGTPVQVTMRKLSEEGPSGVIHYGYKFVPVKDKKS
jgi:hypothetical protein